MGNFPPLFAEWNDHFRDSARRFWLQQNVSPGILPNVSRPPAISLPAMASRHRRRSTRVTAHDGFTLRDCVCFNQKHNEANGEENRDGTNNNYSNNHGIEGLEANFAVIERRRASAHALLTTLLLAQGTPMLLAGDEQGHSQHGNNNAYCRDNALTWLDWRREPGLTAFTAALIHLRRRIPALTRNRWWQEGMATSAGLIATPSP